MGTRHKKEVVHKGTQNGIGKYIGDIEQGHRIDPDLVESIMKPHDSTQEELRRTLINKNLFEFQFVQFEVFTFQVSAKLLGSRRRLLPAGATKIQS